MAYRDFGAAQVFDCVDFGLPSTHPARRAGMDRLFDRMLDTCFSTPADAVLIECGGDIVGLNVPTFLRRLRRRRSRPKVILVAGDALGAFGATWMLRKMGLPVDLITGPCTDTPAVQQRTQSLCRSPAMNLGPAEGTLSLQFGQMACGTIDQIDISIENVVTRHIMKKISPDAEVFDVIAGLCANSLRAPECDG